VHLAVDARLCRTAACASLPGVEGSCKHPLLFPCPMTVPGRARGPMIGAASCRDGLGRCMADQTTLHLGYTTLRHCRKAARAASNVHADMLTSCREGSAYAQLLAATPSSLRMAWGCSSPPMQAARTARGFPSSRTCRQTAIGLRRWHPDNFLPYRPRDGEDGQLPGWRCRLQAGPGPMRCTGATSTAPSRPQGTCLSLPFDLHATVRRRVQGSTCQATQATCRPSWSSLPTT
jgi:hypothetical protein